MSAPSSSSRPLASHRVVERDVTWELADEVLRRAGPEPWIDPRLIAIRMGFDLAVGPEAPTPYCVFYAWDQARDARGWNVYQSLAMSLVLREGIVGGRAAALRLARLLAISTRRRSEVLARQQHCPHRVLVEALKLER